MFDSLIANPFLRGLIVGLLMAAPIGAVGVMCIKRSLSDGWLRAMAVGMGSAVVDAGFGTVAGLGLTFVSTFVTDHQVAIGVVGSVIVMGIGVATYLSPVKAETVKVESGLKRRDFATAFMLSVSNPATLLGAVGLFAALGQVDPKTAPQSAMVLIGGVFAGSMAWWVFLTAAAGFFRQWFVPETLARMNKIEGAVIAVLGAGLALVILGDTLFR